MAKPIEAAGGLVVRSSEEGPQVLVVHRPRYDDWTFPKGKNEEGESPEKAALREVEEETGQRARLIAPAGRTEYQTSNGPKRVDWFTMRVYQPAPFVPNGEVDQINWLSPQEAATRLSNQNDRDLLQAADLGAVVTTGTLFLVRHGAAGYREAWTGNDRLRPLSPKGQRQAAGVAQLLANREIEAIVTSPFVRCRQTVEPLAEALGLDLLDHDALAEAEGSTATRKLVTKFLGVNAVMCTHGDVIPALLDWMGRKGMALKSPFECKKGSTWEVEVKAGKFRKARYHPPGEP
ncbi:MAG: NUDIX hydrolase [Acidimicrobiia bacterium]